MRGQASGRHPTSAAPVATLPRPQLFSRNADVDRVNAAELARLPGTLVTCQALDGVTLQEDKPESSGGGRRREPLTPAERQRCDACQGCRRWRRALAHRSAALLRGCA
jgi:hypothetical protein